MPPPPLPAAVPLRHRGEGSGYTGTQTSFPTAPPSSTQRHGIPKIAGSEGGFLGLVIGLGVLFIGCSVAVWLLLKRRQQHGRRALPFFGRFIGGGAKQPKDRSIPSGTFGRLGSGDSHGGWVRTKGADDDSDDENTGKTTGARSVKLTDARSRSPNTASPRPAEREGLYSNDSNPFATPSSTRFPEHVGPYGDAFTTRPSTDSLDEAVHQAQHSPGSSTRDRPPTFASPPMSPSFGGGTKFKETF